MFSPGTIEGKHNCVLAESMCICVHTCMWVCVYCVLHSLYYQHFTLFSISWNSGIGFFPDHASKGVSLGTYTSGLQYDPVTQKLFINYTTASSTDHECSGTINSILTFICKPGRYYKCLQSFLALCCNTCGWICDIFIVMHSTHFFMLWSWSGLIDLHIMKVVA